MCGIVGIVNADAAPVDRDCLARMNGAVRHRGPDDDGAYVSDGVGLAVRRLAVIDLQTGAQPIHSEDRSKWTVFNGEIYNYRALRAQLESRGHAFYTASDTEVIVHAYEAYGTDCPRYLHGMFAFAIWDEREKSLFLARDRVGEKPLLYARVGSGLVFASEFQALLEHRGVARDIDWEAIHHYLTLLSVPGPLTAYREIRKLQPGHWLRWQNGRVQIERYWHLDFSPKLTLGEREAGERLVELLRNAVRARTISDVPLGAFLSGGIDSSAVVALMAQDTSRPVNTFSIGFEEEDFCELEHARRVAAHVGADHHECVVRPDATTILPTLVEHYGEPFADSSAIATYCVSREARAHVTVALSGDGGDECLAGYRRYAAMRLSQQYLRLPVAIRESVIAKIVRAAPGSDAAPTSVGSLKRFVAWTSSPPVDQYLRWFGGFSEEAKRALYTGEFLNETASFRTGAVLEPWLAAANGQGIVDALLLTDTMTYLPDDLLVKTDIASMAVSLETRSPFLDHHVLEFAARLPEHFKLRRLTMKYLLKRALRSIVPAKNLTRGKMGFGVPIRHWFRGPLRPFLRDTLLSDTARHRGWFKPQAVGRIIDEHLDGRAAHEHRLWTLLVLELWCRRFID